MPPGLKRNDNMNFKFSLFLGKKRGRKQRNNCRKLWRVSTTSSDITTDKRGG